MCLKRALGGQISSKRSLENSFCRAGSPAYAGLSYCDLIPDRVGRALSPPTSGTFSEPSLTLRRR